MSFCFKSLSKIFHSHGEVKLKACTSCKIYLYVFVWTNYKKTEAILSSTWILAERGGLSYTGCASISHSIQCKQTIGWPTRKERDFVELFAVKVREQQVCTSSVNINLHFTV